jgi:hypothetical protein
MDRRKPHRSKAAAAWEVPSSKPAAAWEAPSSSDPVSTVGRQVLVGGKGRKAAAAREAHPSKAAAAWEAHPSKAAAAVAHPLFRERRLDRRKPHRSKAAAAWEEPPGLPRRDPVGKKDRLHPQTDPMGKEARTTAVVALGPGGIPGSPSSWAFRSAPARSQPELPRSRSSDSTACSSGSTGGLRMTHQEDPRQTSMGRGPDDQVP